MHVEVKNLDPFALRVTFEGAEAYYLKVALERACYMDTSPEDQIDTNRFAETLLQALTDYDLDDQRPG